MKRLRWVSAFGLAAVVWSAGLVVGHAVAAKAETVALTAAEQAAFAAAAPTPEPLREQPAPVAARSEWATFIYILGRNSAVYIWLLAGLCSVGAVTFAVLAYNGVQLGITIGLALQAGVPGGQLVDLLLPHGVLEMGAFFVAGAVGFQGARLGSWSRHGWDFVKSLRLGSVLVFGLAALTCAAAVEAFVTLRMAPVHA